MQGSSPVDEIGLFQGFSETALPIRGYPETQTLEKS